MIRIGTSSWADPEFVRDWYPPKLPAAHRLGWYAQHFDYVEVNSTFYAIPAEPVVKRWAETTPEGFLFDVKLHKLFSGHVTKPEALPKDLRAGLTLTPRGTVRPEEGLLAGVAHEFLAALKPLQRADKLGALLLQMSPSFGPGAHRLSELEDIVSLFPGLKVAVELRNRYWFEGDRKEDTMAFFREGRIPLVLLDEPEGTNLMILPPIEEITDPSLAYLRLHGRNEHGFTTGKSVPERFDYDYSEEELGEIGSRVRHLAGSADELHVAFNNNRSNYAPKAALALKRRLAETQ